MNKFITLSITLFGTLMMSAQTDVVTLDLTKATTPLTFDAESGKWDGTYDDDAESIESQCFSIVHNSMGEWSTWWGFTASTSHDNTRPENTLTHQWSNMAQGGIVLNEDGTVKVDENGTPVVSAEVPYLVSFVADNMFGPHSSSIVFNDGKLYEPQGIYVNLNSYTYYTIEYGDAFARAFHNGDSFKLTIHGVDKDGSEKTVETLLASYTNGDLTINRGWKYVDLSSLGTVNELYFTLDTTDTGAYGPNTPCYFCMDKLSVKPAVSAGINSVSANAPTLSYDRSTKTVNVGGADFAAVYNCAGQMVMSSDKPSFSISSLDAGVYVVKAGNSSLKIAK